LSEVSVKFILKTTEIVEAIDDRRAWPDRLDRRLVILIKIKKVEEAFFYLIHTFVRIQ